MKKNLLLLTIYCLLPIYSFAGLLPNATPIGVTHALAGQSSLNHEWIVWLDNDSYWLIKNMEKRDQTWSEWWNNQVPLENQLDDSFYFNAGSWGLGSSIQVYETETIHYTDYPYLLENMATGQKAFAKVVCPNSLRLPKVQAAHEFLDNPIGNLSFIKQSLYRQINIITLEDSSWYLFKVDTIGTSFSDWWYNNYPTQPDDQFLSTYEDWCTSDPVRVYSKDWASCDSNNEYKKNCVLNTAYLIENKKNGKLAYALPVEPEAVIEKLLDFAEKQYQLGYKNGYNNGYNEGYNKGKAAGYSSGYNAGRQSSKKS